LREAFPYDSAPGYLIFDRGANFNQEVIDTVKIFGIQPKRTSFRSPWQNGVAERFVGNCRRDLLDHVVLPRLQMDGRSVSKGPASIDTELYL
jgi:transposase InsO family protein